MQFTRVQFDSFKCFVDESVDLEAGVTAMYGANGAGKTSLLEGCFFALYGAAALPTGENLADVIEKGEDEAVVELWFTHSGGQYRIRRRVREYETQTDHEVELTTPEGTIEDPGPVGEAIEDLFRLDADAFLNCAYVRQGDINKLITANPGDRQDMIDQLLQLGKLDRYEDRMGLTRNGIRNVKENKQGTLNGVERDIEALEDRNLNEQLERIEAEIDDVDDEMDELDDEIEALENEQREADDDLEELSDLKSRVGDLETELDGAKSNLGEELLRRKELENELQLYTNQIEECESTAEDRLEETEVDSLDVEAVEARLETVDRRLEGVELAHGVAQERASEFRESATDAEETATELDGEADDLEAEAEKRRGEADEMEADLRDPRSKLQEVQDDMEAIEERFSESPTTRDTVETYKQEIEGELEDAREELTDLQSELTAVRERVGHARLLLIEGRCPECGQEVEGAPSVSSYEEDRVEVRQLKEDVREASDGVGRLEEAVSEARGLNEAAGEYEALEARGEDLRREIQAQSRTIESLRQEADQLDDEASAKRSRAAYHRTAIPHLDAIADREDRARNHLSHEHGMLTAEREALAAAREALSEANQKRRERIQVSERLEEDIDPQIDHWKAERGRIKGELEDAREDLDPDRIKRLERRLKGASRWQSELEARRAELESRRGELREKKGSIETEIGKLSRKRDERDRVSQQIERLEAAIRQCEETEQMYQNLREDLRTRNVDELERLLNELFDLLYQTDSYARFDLSDSYELTVYEKSGETLDPTDLSGGERALFNLALRCAIYQLLTEGLSGQAPLPPLILDEPTVYLDDQHVNELSALITRMRELGVDQIIVVSHQEELVDAADERIEIRQDSTTNRSHTRVESRDLLA